MPGTWAQGAEASPGPQSNARWRPSFGGARGARAGEIGNCSEPGTAGAPSTADSRVEGQGLRGTRRGRGAAVRNGKTKQKQRNLFSRDCVTKYFFSGVLLRAVKTIFYHDPVHMC